MQDCRGSKQDATGSGFLHHRGEEGVGITMEMMEEEMMIMITGDTRGGGGIIGNHRSKG